MKKKSPKSALEAGFGVPPPVLVITLEPWHTAFFGNLRDCLRRPDFPGTSSTVGEFWPDVFVASYVPWRRFSESVAGHVAALAMIWGLAQLWQERPHAVDPPAFHSADVIYYQPAEYLPPLDTGGTTSKLQKAGDPAYAPQPIISVPPEADNRRQTIVAPPNVKLEHDVPLPNMVAWERPQPTVPIAATRSATKLPDVQASVVAPVPEIKGRLRSVPQSPDAVVAPPPELQAVKSRTALQTPEASVIAPPPNMEKINTRMLGDINIARANVVAPAPQLPLGEQHASMRVVQTTDPGGATVVPPQPSASQISSGSGGRIIALNVQPLAVGGPPEVPNANRRGTFAATPEGKPGASGTPGGTGGSNQGGSATSNGTGTAGASGDGKKASGLPSGLFVGASKSGPVAAVAGEGQGQPSGQIGSALMAKAIPPRVSSTPRNSGTEPSAPTDELERRVFGDNRIYKMTLNTPNLNSAGGSWVMHFADIDQSKPGELAAPVAIQEVDPGYPIELMRKNVQGTVMLSAVIFPDGTVGGVHVLRGLDDALDQYACNALARWRFQPATKNGTAVAVKTVVVIPFRPMHVKGF